MSSKLITPDVEQAMRDIGIRVTRRPAESPNGNPKEAKAMTTNKKGGFTLPTISTTPEEQAANEEAFNDLMSQVPEFVAQYATKAAELLNAGHSAEDMVRTAEQFCDADVTVFPGAKNFVGDQQPRFVHAARVNFVTAMLRQAVPDRALASVKERVLQTALGWDILVSSKEKPEIGVQIDGTWYTPTKEYEDEVYDLNFLMLLSEKARGAYLVGRDEIRDDAAALRALATVKSVSDFLSVTKEDLTTEVALRGHDGKPRQVPAAPSFVWFPRQKIGTKEKDIRHVTHEGGALLCAYLDTRTWTDRKTDEKMSYTGIFVSLMPPTHEGLLAVDGKELRFDNDGEGYEEVRYEKLSDALKPLASPVSDRGYRLAPRAIPMEALQDLDKFRLELPSYFFSRDEFDLYRRLSWAFKCALKQESDHEAHTIERKDYNSKATVSFVDFYGLEAKAGTCYSFLNHPWRDGKGKKHWQVHFLASRAEVGGEVVLAEYPEKHKALLTDPYEFKKIVRELTKIAKRSSEKTGAPEVSLEIEGVVADAADEAKTEVTSDAVADAPKPKVTKRAKGGKAKAKTATS